MAAFGKVPEGLSDELINSTKGYERLKAIASRFEPAVSTANCNSQDEIRERLRCGLKRANGTMKNLDSLTETMSRLKQSDAMKRKTLIELFVRLENYMRDADSSIIEQLEKEDSTRRWAHNINMFIEMLHRETCPVVVAGQVTAGKSSLLNLFLGEECLPSQLLSCTATVCELAYCDRTYAALLHSNGCLERVPFEDKDSFIYKKSERGERFDHQAVHLHMPVPFLKSGITLVDTPGVGENKILGTVLLDYVEKNDVFGFIFVIKCNDSGGVLQRFREMLRQLAMVKDSQGQFKLDPKSVIFVANFWDKVPPKERKDTRELIESTLMKETCLKGFDPKKQMFYMNSLFAWTSWQAGLVSEDYERLMNGVENFFPIGHRHKLSLAHRWLEKVITRVLHPVHAFLNKGRLSFRSLKRNMAVVIDQLNYVELLLSKEHSALTKNLEDKRDKLRTDVRDFVKKESTRHDITTWRSSQIPSEELGDTWILLEDRLQQAIDERISSVLEDWENNSETFAKAEHVFSEEVRERYGTIFYRLDLSEKQLRSISGDDPEDKQAQKAKFEPRDSLDFGESTAPREIKVEVAQELGSVTTFPREHILQNLVQNPVALFKVDKQAVQKQRQQDAQKYQQDKAKFMKELSSEIIQGLLSNNQFIKDLVDVQLVKAKQHLECVQRVAQETVTSNISLCNKLMVDDRDRPVLQATFQPIADRFDGLMDSAVDFKYRYITDFEYPAANLKTVVLPQIGANTRELFGSISHHNDTITGQKITTKMMKLAPNGVLTKQHMFYLTNNMRSRTNAQQCLLPHFLGLCGIGPSLVFNGHLRTARAHLLSRKSNRRIHIQTVVSFLKEVAQGLLYLHLWKFVHVELSVDTVLVDSHGIPKLINIFESTQLPRKLFKGKETGNYVYIAPETFPGKNDGKYTAAADVYALGLMVLELWSQEDLYASVKELPLESFIKESDPGKMLLQCVARTKFASNYPPIVDSCLSHEPKERYKIREWLDEWNLIVQKYA